MKRMARVIFLLALIHCCAFGYAQKMNNQKLYQILDSVTDSIEGQMGAWSIKYNDRPIVILTDETHNRMRMVAPIQTVETLSQDEIISALMANFHTVLDVKYAISEGVMWAAFIHPLKQLSEEQIRDGLSQVYRAASTFGTTYSSTELIFPGNQPPKADEKPVKKKM